jgi:hypothetical protein
MKCVMCAVMSALGYEKKSGLLGHPSKWLAVVASGPGEQDVVK